MPDHKFNIYSGLLKAYEADDNQKRLKTVASSSIRDRSGDVMTERAIRKMAESAKDNLTIFLNHSYKVPEDVFGSVESVGVIQHSTDVWDLEFDIRLNESNERALKTYEAIQNGTKLGTSIGAALVEGGYKRDKSTGGLVFDDVELLEASIVGIPANPRSWVQYARKSLMPEEIDDDSVTFSTSTSTGSVSVTFVAEEKEVAEITKDEEVEAAPPPEEADPSHPENNEPVGDPGNETPAQEVETTVETEVETSVETTDPDDADGGEAAPDAIKAADFASLVDLLRSTTGELVEARKAQAEAEAAKSKAEDQLRSMQHELEQAKEIVETVASLPIGRRSVVQNHVNDFRTRFDRVYGEDFVKMLEKNNDAGS